MERDENYVRMARRVNGTWCFEVIDKKTHYVIKPFDATPQFAAKCKATLSDDVIELIDKEKYFAFQAGPISINYSDLK